MSTLALKVPVVESEAGWGRKIDDYMVVLSMDDAKAFEQDFNSKNKPGDAPEWYMQVDGTPSPVDLTSSQFEYLEERKRVWWSELKSK